MLPTLNRNRTKRHTFGWLLAVMLAVFIPIKHFGQIPYRQYADNGILLNFFELDNLDYRIYLLYNIEHDDQFTLSPDHESGQFVVNPRNEAFEGNFLDTFETFYRNTLTAFGEYDKSDLHLLLPQWKEQVTARYMASITLDVMLNRSMTAQNTCSTADCFNTAETFTYQPSTSGQLSEAIPGTGCVSSTGDPRWFFMRIQNPGQFIIYMSATNSRDINFVVWGPFTSPTAPCTSQLTNDNIIDCCFSSSNVERAYFGYAEGNHNHDSGHGTIHEHTPQAGEYYILLICNYSSSNCTITVRKQANSGPGTTNCEIESPVIRCGNDSQTYLYDCEYCVGDVIRLHCDAVPGATYYWTGPNGWHSSSRNAVRGNCTMAMAGTYTCTVTVGGSSATSTLDVVVNPAPVANFTFTDNVCAGEPVTFTSTSTTNPTGYTISDLTWDFGDGQTGSGANVTHTYAAAGTYQVTLTASNGPGQPTTNKCISEITQTVTVEECGSIEVSNSGPYCVGDAIQLFCESVPGATQYYWTGPNGWYSYNRNPVRANCQLNWGGTYTCTVTVNGQTHTATTEVIVYPKPNANFTFTEVCVGSPTSFTSTSTTNPAGQTIQNYSWDFGDGQTGIGANVTHTYAAAGTYNVTLTVSTGDGHCTSEITKEVHVYEGYSETISETACDGYTWNGTTYTQSGTYTYYGQTAPGCDSIVILNLTINPTLTGTYEATICDSQLPFTFHGQTFTEAGSQTITIPNATPQGCDSVVTPRRRAATQWSRLSSTSTRRSRALTRPRYATASCPLLSTVRPLPRLVRRPSPFPTPRRRAATQWSRLSSTSTTAHTMSSPLTSAKAMSGTERLT